MENLVFRLTDDKWKSLMISGGHVHLSSSRYDSPVEFYNAIAKKGLLESLRAIPIAGITQLSMIPAEDTVKFHWLDEGGKEKKMAVDFDTEQDALSVAEGVAARRDITRTTRGSGKWDALKTPLIALLVTAALTTATYAAAVEIADGGEVEIHGRRAWLKLIISEVARLLGPTGTFAVGGTLCLGLLYWLYRRWEAPPIEHVWR